MADKNREVIMKIAVTAQGTELSSFVDPRFGRCQYFLFIDTDDIKVEAVANPARQASGGAGIQAADFVVGKGVQAVITGTVGPNAEEVLKKSSIPVYRAAGTVSVVIDKFKIGKLPQDAGRG